MKCLSTRKRPDGLTRRRYLLDDGHRESTIEVPAAVLRYFGSRFDEALARYRRGEAVRKLRRKVDALILAGWKPTAIASETGMTERAVRKRRSKLKEAGELNENQS